MTFLLNCILMKKFLICLFYLSSLFLSDLFILIKKTKKPVVQIW